MIKGNMKNKKINIMMGGILALALIFFTNISQLMALEVPELKGRVNDYAHMLSPSTVNQLNAALRELEQTDSTQIVVLTVPSLEGDSLEDFSMRVAEKWKIGQKGLDNGAILLIAKKERKLRIEVGYGLEGKMTDLMAGRIIRNIIVPHFKAGQFNQGVIEGVQAMIAVVRGEYTATSRMKPTRHRPPNFGSIFFLIIIFFFLINMMGRIKKPLGAAAGGLFFPILGASIFGLGLLGALILIPIGMIGGLVISLFGGPLTFAHMASSSSRRGGIWFGGSGGGFSSGGFGGFSGGGGGFGGGGASGGW